MILLARGLPIVFLLLGPAALASAQAPLQVGSAVAPPGSAASGFIEVKSAADAGARIPVSVVNGARPGPVLALVAGTHGYEYPPILALQRLLPRLDPKRMAGAVILVHIANAPAFYGRRIYYNEDGRNLNRAYPGKPDGSQTERIAWAITREVIERATHLIDLHCGDGNESLRPYAYWTVSGNRGVDGASKRLVLAFGLDHIVVDRERPKDPAVSQYTANTATLRGKPAITVESGGMGLSDEASVRTLEAGALSAMAELGILEAPSLRVEKPLWIEPSEVVRSPASGIWQPVAEKMQSVAAGTLLGRVSDPFGAVLAEVRAPFAGELLYVVGTPPVSEGEPLAFVGKILEGEPKS